ncbi:hypothetical protein CsSME_00034391 [Camellia sinensis var. sinensis]
MEPKPNQGKDYWNIEHIPEVKLSSRIRKQGPIGTHFGSLQDYFNRKVFCCKCIHLKQIQLQKHPEFKYSKFLITHD